MPQRQMHRETFLAYNGIGPYRCHGCGFEISFRENFDVHHIDGNHDNQSPENLAAMHNSCHIRIHRTGKIASAETRAKMSAAFKGRKLSKAHVASIARGHTGLKRSADARARMSAAQKGRIVSAQHRQKISETLRAAMNSDQRHFLSEIGKKGASVRWNRGDE